MKLEALTQMNVTVGTKSLIRRLNAGEVREVFLAEDADLYLKKKLTALCEEKGVPVNQAPSMLFYPAFSAPRLPSLLRPDLPVSREDRAMAGDFAVHSEVMKSVAAYLRQVPLFEITATGARPRFGNPFAIPYGHVPMGNSSNPFVTAMTPGWQPEPYKYSPESIPQCIRLEYDFASGTWKQVMVDWEEYTEQMSGFSGNLQTEPVPAVPVTPVERAMRR